MSLRLPFLVHASAPSLPIPRGWYVISESDAVARGDVRPVTAFGRELVVFRTEDGQAHVVNAHCPHLGAHLGHGGTIVGNDIRCPFHGWQFEGKSGRCMKAAHGDPVPPRAELQRWHVDEQDGVILVWFHDEGAAPDWHVPPQPDFGLSWSPWRRRTWEFKARIQDVGENDADISHSPVMHGLTDELPRLTMETSGPICDWTMELTANRSAFGLPDLPWALDLLRVPKVIPAFIEVRRTGFSLGLIRQRSTLPGGWQIRSQTFISTTPIDAQHVRVVARHRVRPTPLRPLTRIVLDKYSAAFDTTFEEDIVIWSNKVYRMRPAVSKSDWAVIKLRKWARQFYAEGVYEDLLRHEDELRRAGTLL
jgi:3-ketosteroid 9alpha-monooxygenase subunit A